MNDTGSPGENSLMGNMKEYKKSQLHSSLLILIKVWDDN